MSAKTPITVQSRQSKGTGGKPGLQANETIDVKGNPREFRLVAPEKMTLEKPMTLIFAFHGLGDSKDIMPVYSRLDNLVEKHGCILVYPNGNRRCWPLLLAITKPDLDFFDALYKDLTSKYNIDLNRVYVTGMSNGAYFSHILASQRSEKIAAIAPHSGGIGFVGLNSKKSPAARKYPVLAIHGDRDDIINVTEGHRTRDVYTQWEHEIEYEEIKGLKHAWGTISNINTRIWEFFDKNPMK